MFSITKIREGALKARALYVDQWNELSASDNNKQQSLIDAGTLDAAWTVLPCGETTSTWSGKTYTIMPPVREVTQNVYSTDIDEMKIIIEKLKQQRLEFIIWTAYTVAMRNMEAIDRLPASSNYKAIQFTNRIVNVTTNVEDSEPYELFTMMATVKIEKQHLNRAVRDYKDLLETIERRYQSAINATKDSSTGLAKVLNPNLVTTNSADNIIMMHEAIKAMPQNGLTARTWGFEVEVPDAKDVSTQPGDGIEKGDDGSLRSYQSNDDCQCCCGDCTYHECDCDNCDQQNDDPEHCNDSECSTADSAEFRSVGGIQKLKHSGLYKLCELLEEEDAEKNDTAGTHIHVWAGDLTTNQVGQVMAMYKRVENIIRPVAGRYDTTYARAVKYNDVSKAIRKHNPALRPEKQLAVNISQLFTQRRTIEFRQMDCNLNADQITFWAWMVRGFVSAAKRGATFVDLKEAKSINDIIEMLGRYNHFLHDETPEEFVYGSKSDMWAMVPVNHGQL